MHFQTFDSDYLDKLRCGDHVTEQHFVRYFSELISLKMRSRLQSPQAVQDVKQETFARVFTLLRSEGGIRHGERLGALVNSVCNNVLFEHYRASNRAAPLEDTAAANLLDQRSSPLRDVITEEARSSVHLVLAQLGERDRKILHALFVEDRDRDEICMELHIDREYMRVLVHRAKQSFRLRYEQKFGAGAKRR